MPCIPIARSQQSHNARCSLSFIAAVFAIPRQPHFMQLFVHHNGIQLGPYPPEVIHAQLANGSLDSSDLGWYEGMVEWQPLASIPGIVGAPQALSYPATSGLSIASMICGLLVIFSWGITGLPAVICGHMARGRIKRSGGTLNGSGFALTGLILGYIGLVIFPLMIAAIVWGATAAVKTAKKTSALSQVFSIEVAANSFYLEYSTMPPGTGIYDTALDVSLAEALIGDDKSINTKGVKFLTMRTSYGKTGLDPLTHQIHDQWGNGYVVILDTDYNGEIAVSRGGINETVMGHHALVYSKGADGVAGTTDDVKSW